jgi:AraC-like DNA-binding protein
VTNVTTIPASTSSKRRPKDPAATIALRDGDEGWTVPALAAYAKTSERTFRKRFAATGLVPLTRIGGVNFGSIARLRNALSDMIAGGDDPKPRRPRRRRR